MENDILEIKKDVREIKQDMKGFIEITTSNKVSIRYIWYIITGLAGAIGIPKLWGG